MREVIEIFAGNDGENPTASRTIDAKVVAGRYVVLPVLS
jgi:hypothetical protein